MRRNLLALLAATLFAAPAALAHHDSPGTGQSERSAVSGQGNPTIGLGTAPAPNPLGRADEPKKHLAEIDVYLRDAIANVKVIYETTQLQPGNLDASMQREGLANVDRSLASALLHIGHMKSLPEARVADTAKVAQLERDLTDSRKQLVKLRNAIRTDAKSQIQLYSSKLYGELRSADESFAQLALQSNLTRIDQISVPEKQPVAGHPASSVEKQVAPGRGLGPQNDPAPLPGVQEPTNAKPREDDRLPSDHGLLDRGGQNDERIPDHHLDLPQQERGNQPPLH